MEATVTKYQSLPLEQLAEKLNIDFYAVVKALCQKANEQLANLRMLDIHQVSRPYSEVCGNLLARLNQHIDYRREELATYLQKLSKKDYEGHDCGSCSGKCDMEHASHIMQLKESHSEISAMILKLKGIVLPIYANAPYYGIYRVLYNEMTLVDEIIHELFYLEEHGLLPKILAAQKKINAGS